MVRIQICRGMACSSYGGGRVLERCFEQELEKAGCLDQITFLSAHCMGECHSGPCVRINGVKFYQVSPADVPQLVQNEVLPQLDQ